MHWLKDNFENLLVSVLTAFMTIALFLQILSRYVFNFSITWTEELSIFGLMWITYFGAAIAVVQRRHIRITILSDFLPDKVRKILDIACNIAFMIFISFVTTGIWSMFKIAMRTHQQAAASGLPRWVPIIGIVFAFVLIVLRLIQDTVKHVREYREMFCQPKKDGDVE
ncbi:MAG: TRAP transporter small permease [Desulfovibrionaceae bacterium]|jgi:TRAP-type C4-dicarboxylate transport system permease small subunit|nr:TRAP transporter small permease [Desulfovibrionaceae bacterium]